MLTLLLMVRLTLAENTYPSKAVIGNDTVICSTPEQQKKYLQWKDNWHECKDESIILIDKIKLQDIIISEQKKQIAELKLNSFDFKKVLSNQKELIEINDMQFKKLETAYKKQVRKNKLMSIGLSTGIIAVNVCILAGLFVFLNK